MNRERAEKSGDVLQSCPGAVIYTTAEELCNPPATQRWSFPPKPNQSVTAAEGRSEKVVLVHDVTLNYGEIKKLV